MDGAMFQNARRLSQAVLPATTLQTNLLAFWNMAPSMKATTKAMTKGALADALATGTEVKKSQCTKLLDSLAKIATAEVKKAGLFTVPGLLSSLRLSQFLPGCQEALCIAISLLQSLLPLHLQVLLWSWLWWWPSWMDPCSKMQGGWFAV